ncbi:MAG: hypothetical protein IKV55_00800, partial [Oscillospiraceae bacterium]|nr:hypothetical protein [Oscillospiraceae bacterium]
MAIFSPRAQKAHFFFTAFIISAAATLLQPTSQTCAKKSRRKGNCCHLAHFTKRYVSAGTHIMHIHGKGGAKSAIFTAFVSLTAHTR